MRKTISILLAVVMTVTIWGIPGMNAFATGDEGTTDDSMNVEQTEDMYLTDEELDEYVDEDTDEELDVDEEIDEEADETAAPDELTEEEELDEDVNDQESSVAEPKRFGLDRLGDGELIELTADNTKVIMDKTYLDYTGKAVEPAVTVKYTDADGNTVLLTQDVDYTVKYKNNILSKESKAVVTGTGAYAGTVEKVFYIGMVQGLKVKANVTTATLSWTEEPNVTGYKIFKYSYATDEATLLKTVKGSSTTSAKVTGLKTAGLYTFFVRSYAKDKDGNNIWGPINPKGKKTVLTGCKKVKLTSAKVSKRPNKTIYAKWSKTRCTGYQVQVAKKKSFTKSSIVRSFKTKNVSRSIKKGLAGKTKYYIRVRAYVKKDGYKIKYGKWSNIKSATPKSKGWYTDSKGLMYYYNKGNMVKGEQTFTKDETKFKYYYFDKKGVFRGFSKENWDEVDGASSNKTRGGHYLFSASRNLCRFVIYRQIDGNWAPYKWGLCGPGRHDFPTPAFNVKACGTLGKWKQEKRLHFGDPDGYRCWYYTRVKNTIGLHSIKYRVGSKSRLREPYYHQLGHTVSHGCIRLSLSDAYWCYKHIWKGARVIVVNDDQKAERSKVTL